MGVAATFTPIAGVASMLPSAAAQTQNLPLPQPAYGHFQLDRRPDGKLLIVGTSPLIKGDQKNGTPTYVHNGVTYKMSLVEFTEASKTIGEPAYYWSVDAENGNRSNACAYDISSYGVADRGLVVFERNGFLEDAGTVDGPLFMRVQHFDNNWRVPIAAGQNLTNVTLTFDFPAGAEPVRSQDTVFTPVTTIQLATGGTKTISGYNPSLPSGHPTDPRWGPVPDGDVSDEWVIDGPRQNGDGTWTLTASIDELKEGASSVLQFGQANISGDAPATRVSFEAARPCTEPLPSGSSEQCTAAATSVGLPLLLLIPLGIASQVRVPGIDALSGQLRQQIVDANNRLQQQTGIFNGDAARLAAQLDGYLAGPEGRALAGAALIAAGLLATGYVASNCLPGSSGSSLAGSSLGSDGGSAELLGSATLSSGSSES